MANEHSSIMLMGLKGSHPLGALAAFGLLRCLNEMSEFSTPRLHWELRDDWLAVLTTDQPVSTDDLVSCLVKRIENWRNRLEFNWADKISTDPHQFITRAREAIDKANPRSRSTADFFTAFGCVRNSKLRRTAFDMTDGQQGLMKNMRALAQSLTVSESGEVEVRRSLHEALFGPWRYDDHFHSLGLEPSMESLYALRANDPSLRKNQHKRSVRSAIYLAVEALSLFPCAPVDNKLVTTGFTEMRRKVGNETKQEIYFSWPVWRTPLCLEEIRSLLALKALTLENPPLGELQVRGIAKVFRSHKVKTGEKGNRYIFRAAYPCTEVKTNTNYAVNENSR